MSFELIKKVNDAQKKAGALVDVKSGDKVRVHQKIKEGNKERVQVFEGVVIRVDRKQSHTARITVRKIASGVGVEKSFLLHSPLIEKIEVVRSSKVRRNYLSYMRERSGKSARLKAIDARKPRTAEAPAEPAPEIKTEPAPEAKAESETKPEAKPATKPDTETEAK